MLLKKNDDQYSTYLGILAILFWGSTIAFSRSLTEQLGSITAGGFVFCLSSLIACLYLLFTSPKRFKKMVQLPTSYLWVCGALFVLYMTSLYLAIGLSHTREQVIEISIVNYLWPGLTLLCSIPVLQKRANFFIIPGVLLSFLGVFLAMNPYYSLSFSQFYRNIQQNRLPYMFALIAAVSWALYSTLARKWAGKDQEGAVPIFLLVTGLVLFLLRLFFPEKSAWSIKVGLELIYMAIFPTFLAYSFWDQAMRRGNIVLVATLSYFTPLLSIFISSIYLQIAIDMRLLIASMLVVIGAFISKFSILERRIS